MKQSIRTTWASLMTLLITLFLALPVMAIDFPFPGGGGGGSDLEIHRVWVSFGSPDMLLIQGQDLNHQGDPVIMIDGVENPLVLDTVSDSDVTAELPVLDDGDYRLTVQTGDRKSNLTFDEFYFTLGAVGPTGPMGPPGPPGESGAAADLSIVYGWVASDGTVWHGSGFTSTRTGTGQYTVTYNTSFGGRPAVVFFPDDNLVDWTINGNSSFSITVRNASGSAVDSEFSFIAIGPE